MAIHWGILRRVREEVKAKAWVLITALALDAAVLGALLVTQTRNDPLVLGIAGVSLLAIFGGEWLFLQRNGESGHD